MCSLNLASEFSWRRVFAKYRIKLLLAHWSERAHVAVMIVSAANRPINAMVAPITHRIHFKQYISGPQVDSVPVSSVSLRPQVAVVSPSSLGRSTSPIGILSASKHLSAELLLACPMRQKGGKLLSNVNSASSSSRRRGI